MKSSCICLFAIQCFFFYNLIIFRKYTENIHKKISREDAREKVIVQQVQRLDTPPKDEEHHDEIDQNPFHKFGKIGLLVFVWVLMVAFLTSTPEKIIEKRQFSIPVDDVRIYSFPKLPTGTRINATLEGAFLKEAMEQHTTKKFDYINRKVPNAPVENYVQVYLQSDSNRMLTQPKTFPTTKPELFDFTNSSKVPIMFDIGEDNLDQLQMSGEIIQLVIRTNFTKTPQQDKQEMPIIFSYDISPINKQIGVIFAAFVLIFLYALIIWEVNKRGYLKLRINN